MLRLNEVSLRALHIENYRPFSSRVCLESLSSLNVITGPNNAGKSSCLMPLRRLTRMDGRYVPKIPVPDGQGFFGSVHSAVFHPSDLRSDGSQAKVLLRLYIQNLPELFSSEFLKKNTIQPTVPGGGPSEIELELTGGQRFDIRFSSDSRTKLAAFHARFPDQTLREYSDGDVGEFERNLAGAFASRILYVPTFRVAGKTYEYPDVSLHQERMFDGGALLAELLRWCLPDADTGVATRSNRLEQLSEAMSSILDVTFRIWPTTDQQIRVVLGGDIARRLDDLGQGINQLVTITTAVLSMDEAPILLLEEPEVCLHPGLQRRLVDYLAERNIQTFVTTHSNHLIDAASSRGRLFTVRHDADTNTRLVFSIEENLLQAIRDLGVSASSIAAATAVLWVEGPSDAIYIRYWLGKHEEGRSLREGRDFTFAFHGGSLLAHVGLDDELVKLLGVHPGFFLVADSDRKSPGGDPSHRYLQRLLADARFAERIWVTVPKEIEGYISDEDFSDHAPPEPTNVYGKLLNRLIALNLPEYLAENKVELARRTIGRPPPNPDRVALSGHDLADRINAVVIFIQNCRRRLPMIVVPSTPAPS